MSNDNVRYFWGRLVDVLKTSLAETLIKKRDAGDLTPITGIDDYELPFVSGWNRFIEGKETRYDLVEIIDGLVPPFRTGVAYDGGSRGLEHLDAAAADAKVAALVSEMMESGTCEAGLGGNGSLHSPVIKAKIYAGLDNWKPTFIRENPDWIFGDRSTPMYIPLQEVHLRPAATIPVDLPSGRLIIADWVRIKAFTDAVDTSHFKIEHAEERIARSLHVAKEHGFIEVTAYGFQDLVVDRKDGEVTGLRSGSVIRDDYSGEPVVTDLEHLGQVTTQYWAVTMIDYEVLMNILRSAGVDDPEAAYSEWLKGAEGGPDAEIQLDPGRWHLTFIDPRCKSGVCDLEDVTDAYEFGMRTTLALTKEPLKIDPALCITEDLPEPDAEGPRP
jgi:hypothetical protein